MNVLNLPAHTPTRLIRLRDDQRVETQLCTTDATTALTRGVAEYVAPLQAIVPGGRLVTWDAVFDAWAEAEDQAETYPRFVAYTNDNAGKNDWSNMNRKVSTKRFPDGTYLVSGAELNVDIRAELRASDPEERQALVKMLEDAFNPVDWMQGFRLELPHYYNNRATYELVETTYLGNETDAVKRSYKARLILRGAVPITQLMPFKLPIIQVQSAVGPSGAAFDTRTVRSSSTQGPSSVKT